MEEETNGRMREDPQYLSSQSIYQYAINDQYNSLYYSCCNKHVTLNRESPFYCKLKTVKSRKGKKRVSGKAFRCQNRITLLYNSQICLEINPKTKCK